MKAVVYKGPYQVAVEEVPEPRIEEPGDAIPVKRYNRELRDLIIAGRAHPSRIVSHELGLGEAAGAYERFDRREDGWTKVLLYPAA